MKFDNFKNKKIKNANKFQNKFQNLQINKAPFSE